MMAPKKYSGKTELLAAYVRRDIVDMTHRGGSSHVGSGLSIADILAVLYGDILSVDPATPNHDDRDRFILSKGHAGAAIYAVLAETGFFEVEKLKDHYQNGSVLSGHVSHKGVPGVEFSTGSLGHGLNVAAGMAKAAKLRQKNHKVFALLSDGECDEGSNWEAILFSSHHKLNNLVAIIDYNKIQSLDSVEATLGLEPFADKFKAFGWNTSEVDGHDHQALKKSFELVNLEKTRPTVLICHTTKGKGVSFMENSVLWHYRSPQGQEYQAANSELQASIQQLEDSNHA
ncbi:MAG: transketolase [Pseudohongiellaceae bacterium]